MRSVYCAESASPPWEERPQRAPWDLVWPGRRALFPFASATLAFPFPGAFAFLLPGPAGQRLDWLRGGLGLLQLEVSEKRFPVLGCY